MKNQSETESLEFSETKFLEKMGERLGERLAPILDFLKNPPIPQPATEMASMAEDVAKLAEEIASLEEAKAGLEDKVARLESDEYRHDTITTFLNDVKSADPERKIELGVILGLDKVFREAELAEEQEPIPEPEKPKSELELIGEYLLAR